LPPKSIFPKNFKKSRSRHLVVFVVGSLVAVGALVAAGGLEAVLFVLRVVGVELLPQPVTLVDSRRIDVQLVVVIVPPGDKISISVSLSG
jgi:hypothetical protein